VGYDFVADIMGLSSFI